jgi:hypothetical protein
VQLLGQDIGEFPLLAGGDEANGGQHNLLVLAPGTLPQRRVQLFHIPQHQALKRNRQLGVLLDQPHQPLEACAAKERVEGQRFFGIVPGAQRLEQHLVGRLVLGIHQRLH